MSAPGEAAPDAHVLADMLFAARLCAIDPGLGGMILRGGGEVRDTAIAALRDALPPAAPVRRLPAHVDDERLLGGIDLTATLARGRAVSRLGLLAEAERGVVVVPMAERLSDAVAGRIAAAIDTGEVVVERDGIALRGSARFVTVAFDDGIEADERPPAALAERVAFWFDLSDVPCRAALPDMGRGDATERHGMGDPRDRPGSSALAAPFAGKDDGEPQIRAIEALVATAAALGIDSARAPLFALRAARAAARLAGRAAMTDDDVILAARLVLAPRATRLPMAAGEPHSEASPPPDGEDGDDGHGENERGENEYDKDEQGELGPVEDIVLAAAIAALPRDVLARIAAGGTRRAAVTRARGAGEKRKSPAHGRPLGARAGLPGGGRRLSLIDTLRAAAPWQKLRGREDRILIRRDDLRIRRFETRAEAVTIFAVDASGSSALARLAEAKGAVELLLAEAYVKRAQVALIAFRGTAAALLLPPTRSLVRARRALADLPGGGGTPLAAGLNAARDVAEAARARGRTAFVVILTDGRANVAADGRAVRAVAEADAQAAARAIGAAGIAAAFVDISARPRAEGAALAALMRARYLPLPRADAATINAAVRAAQHG